VCFSVLVRVVNQCVCMFDCLQQQIVKDCSYYVTTKLWMNWRLEGHMESNNNDSI
jgi:hypothetical protein